ncbi:AI-2E family transporter, partial [Clostridium botulinum]|uniref:AI-2E family transporter n=1 Tax=Clostridium botulinum TaxID=1491 RepID=UPI002238F071
MTKNKKIPFLEFIPIIVISFLLLKFINNIENIYSFMKSFLSILVPFIWAFGIAYMLNPLMKYFQNKFKLNRILSIILTYIIVIGLLTLFINTFVPKIIKNVGDLFAHSPDYINKTIQWFNENIKYSKAYDMLMENSQISNNIPNLINKISNLN